MPGLADRNVGASGPRFIDRTWADAVDAYAVQRLLQGNAFHEGMKEALASALGGKPGRIVHSGFRIGEDDIAPARPQMRQCELCHQECRPDIVPDGPIEILDAIIIGRGAGDENAGIADENIERPETLQRELDTRLSMQFLRKVARVQDCSTAGVRDRVGDVLYWIGGQAAQNKPRAFPCEFLRDCFADHGATAGNDRNLVL